MDEQLRALDAIPLTEQAQMLLDHCKKKDVENEQEEMLQAYADQDLNALMKLAEGPKGISANFEKELITDRNLRMVHRMDSLVQLDTTCFFPHWCSSFAGHYRIDTRHARTWVHRGSGDRSCYEATRN